MAGQGAKKRVEENRSKLSKLRTACLLGTAVHFAATFLLTRGEASTWAVLGFILAAAVDWGCYKGLSSLAHPILDDKGDMLDGGADLSMRGGFAEYYQDLIYISVFVQIGASLLSRWFWLAFLSVPAYGGYLLWVNILQPYVFAPRGDMPVDEAARKKAERAEKRAEKRRVKVMRR